MAFTAGQKLRASQMNDAIYTPYFHGNNTTAQSLANATWTSILLQTEVFDTHNGHSTTTNTSRYTAVVSGVYQVTGVVGFAANFTGTRGARIAKGGIALQSGGVFVAAGRGAVTPTVFVALNIGEYVEVQGWQDSGGALSTAGNADVGSGMTLRMLPN